MEILTSVEHKGGTAGVVRDGGRMILEGHLGRGFGTVLGEQPASEGLSDDLTAIAGRLPSGAVRAVVIDARGDERDAVVGDGAWIAVVEQPPAMRSLAARFHDAAGSLVAPALPPDWPREPVPDADAPCAACGGRAWDAVQALDESRGGSEDEHGRFVPGTVAVCRACGHEERVGSFSGLEIDDEPDAEHAARMDAWEAEQRAEERRVLRSAQFMPLALDGGPPPKLGSFGGRTADMDDTLEVPEHVGVVHDCEDGGWLVVETSLEEVYEGAETLARRALERVLGEAEAWPDASEPAITVWLRARDRMIERTALAASSDRCEIVVDEEPREFVCVQASTGWAAAGRIGELTVTLSCVGLDRDAVRLRSVEAASILPP